MKIHWEETTSYQKHFPSITSTHLRTNFQTFLQEHTVSNKISLSIRDTADIMQILVMLTPGIREEWQWN